MSQAILLLQVDFYTTKILVRNFDQSSCGGGDKSESTPMKIFENLMFTLKSIAKKLHHIIILAGFENKDE